MLQHFLVAFKQVLKCDPILFTAHNTQIDNAIDDLFIILYLLGQTTFCFVAYGKRAIRIYF